MIRDSLNSVGVQVDDPEPSASRVRSYLASLADAFSLPRRFVLASAQTERDFNPDDTHRLPQVSGVHIGRTLRDADGSPFEIEDDIKADWRANARGGVDRLARQYQVAQLENPFGSLEEWAQQAYSGFSAGNPFRDRYLTTLSDDLPAHPRDRVFLRNFRKAASESHQEKKQPQVPNAQRPSAQQPAQNQTPDTTAKSSVPSGVEPLPGPLQRLKENPGNLFLQAPATSAQANAPTRSLGRVIDLVPSLSNAPSRARSLGDIAEALSSRQGTSQPVGTRPLSGPLERLKEDPRNLFLEPFVSGQHFSQINLNVIADNEGGNKLVPYFPANDPKDKPNVGVTIGIGVDLGQHNPDDFRKIGVPQSVTTKLEPFLGKRGQSAVNALNDVLKRNPSFAISNREADQLNRAVIMSKFNEVGKAYNDASPIANFAELPWQAQTVIADLWYNMGGGIPGGTRGLQNTDFWKQVTSGKWEDALRNLQNFRARQQRPNDRAKDDAAILKQAVDAGTLPRP